MLNPFSPNPLSAEIQPKAKIWRLSDDKKSPSLSREHSKTPLSEEHLLEWRMTPNTTTHSSVFSPSFFHGPGKRRGLPRVLFADEDDDDEGRGIDKTTRPTLIPHPRLFHTYFVLTFLLFFPLQNILINDPEWQKFDL